MKQAAESDLKGVRRPGWRRWVRMTVGTFFWFISCLLKQQVLY